MESMLLSLDIIEYSKTLFSMNLFSIFPTTAVTVLLMIRICFKKEK